MKRAEEERTTAVEQAAMLSQQLESITRAVGDAPKTAPESLGIARLEIAENGNHSTVCSFRKTLPLKAHPGKHAND